MSQILYSKVVHIFVRLAVAQKTIFTIFRFNAYRNDDGKLKVNVNKTNLDNKWNAGNGTCLRNKTFLPYYCAGVFCLEIFISIPFFQPPSIRPISSNSFEISTYCFSEIHLFSKEIWRKNLSASSFETAYSNRIIFFSIGRQSAKKICSKSVRKLSSTFAPRVYR